ncbi:hypothetical protein [Bacillus pumilus]|uniref:hypothetical protein n=1 Tax=Bacillus pumilus TaxID=1408 RepID=UPI0021137103|nr:hypothetical protein [Bacillus pumilus]UUD44688.1 hypothetical protein NPA43_18805 [Bacillus pumilus]
MAKSSLTLKLENQIHAHTKEKGVFSCFEVTIGYDKARAGYERIDFLTLDRKGIWRCYEIKVSLSDFRSSSKKSFVGHYNYFVLTKELYELVKDEIPNHIGVYIGGTSCVKKAKKQELKESSDTLMFSMIRAATRDASKLYESTNSFIINDYRRQIRQLEQQLFNKNPNLPDAQINYELREENFRLKHLLSKHGVDFLIGENESMSNPKGDDKRVVE